MLSCILSDGFEVAVSAKSSYELIMLPYSVTHQQGYWFKTCITARKQMLSYDLLDCSSVAVSAKISCGVKLTMFL